MKLSLALLSFSRELKEGRIRAAGIIRLASELELEGIELADSQVSTEGVEEWLRLLQESRLEVPCYAIPCRLDGSPETVGETVERVLEGCRRAARFAAPYVLFFPTATDRRLSDPQRKFAALLKKCAPYARQLGLEPCVENLAFHNHAFGRVQDLLALCESASPDLRVLYDAGNWHPAGEDPLRALDAVRSKVVHVHLKDWTVRRSSRIGRRVRWILDRMGLGHPRQGPFAGRLLRRVARKVFQIRAKKVPGRDGRLYRAVPIGAGVIDLEAIIHQLEKTDYRGYFSISYHGSGDPAAAIRQGVRHLRTFGDTCP